MDLSSAPDPAALKAFLAFVRRQSPYYREIWRDVPENALLEFYPVTNLTDYWEAARKDDAASLLTGRHESGLVIRSGGTSDKPKVVRVTYQENDASSLRLASFMRMLRIGSDDKIANLFYVGNMYYSFLGIHDALLSLREAINLPISGNMPAEAIEPLLVEHKPTVLMTTLSVASKLAAVMKKRGRQPMSSVRLILYGGEGLYEDQIAPLHEAFPRATLQMLAYGAMDGGTIAFQLGNLVSVQQQHERERDVYSVNWPETVVELVDDDNKPVTTPGVEGRILVTNLVHRLMPFVRYPVGDRASWVDPKRGLFRLLGRDKSVGVRLSGNSMTYMDIRRAVTTALRCAELGHQLEGLQVIIERPEAVDRMRLRVAGDFGGVSPHVAMAAIHAAVITLNPPFEMHLREGLVGPIVVEFCNTAELECSPLSGKVIEVLDRRLLAH